jgi:hypothetical protein
MHQTLSPLLNPINADNQSSENCYNRDSKHQSIMHGHPRGLFATASFVRLNRQWKLEI